jgi:acyl carrier protein
MTFIKIGAFAAVVAAVVVLYVVDRWRNRRALAQLLASREPVSSAGFGHRHYADAVRAEIATFALSMLEECTGYDFTGALPGDDFVVDLRIEELDSLVAVELITAAEQRYSITISNPEAQRTRTIDDFVQLVYAKVAARS